MGTYEKPSVTMLHYCYILFLGTSHPKRVDLDPLFHHRYGDADISFDPQHVFGHSPSRLLNPSRVVMLTSCLKVGHLWEYSSSPRQASSDPVHPRGQNGVEKDLRNNQDWMNGAQKLNLYLYSEDVTETIQDGIPFNGKRYPRCSRNSGLNIETESSATALASSLTSLVSEPHINHLLKRSSPTPPLNTQVLLLERMNAVTETTKTFGFRRVQIPAPVGKFYILCQRTKDL